MLEVNQSQVIWSLGFQCLGSLERQLHHVWSDFHFFWIQMVEFSKNLPLGPGGGGGAGQDGAGRGRTERGRAGWDRAWRGMVGRGMAERGRAGQGGAWRGGAGCVLSIEELGTPLVVPHELIVKGHGLVVWSSLLTAEALHCGPQTYCAALEVTPSRYSSHLCCRYKVTSLSISLVNCGIRGCPGRLAWRSSRS